MRTCGKETKMPRNSIISKFRSTPAERKDLENAIAETETMQAIYDYNIMMGNIEDPAEEDEEDE